MTEQPLAYRHCPTCGAVMSLRERVEQGVCDRCEAEARERRVRAFAAWDAYCTWLKRELARR